MPESLCCRNPSHDLHRGTDIRTAHREILRTELQALFVSTGNSRWF